LYDTLHARKVRSAVRARRLVNLSYAPRAQSSLSTAEPGNGWAGESLPSSEIRLYTQENVHVPCPRSPSFCPSDTRPAASSHGGDPLWRRGREHSADDTAALAARCYLEQQGSLYHALPGCDVQRLVWGTGTDPGRYRVGSGAGGLFLRGSDPLFRYRAAR